MDVNERIQKIDEGLRSNKDLRIFVDCVKSGFTSSEDFIWLGLQVAFRLGVVHEQTEQLRKFEEKAIHVDT